MNNKVYIVEAKRSAIGRFLGNFAQTSAVELASQLLAKVLADHTELKDSIDEVIVGNVLSGGLGQNVARQISINAGLSHTVPAYTVNMVCGSGLKAIQEAYNHIKLGDNQVVVAAGVESMSQAKFMVKENLRIGSKLGNMTFEDTLLRDGLTDAFSEVHMGITAENIAKTYAITREEQDEFALNSQEKARTAQQAGRFIQEIIPLTVKSGRETIEVSEDEYINYTTNLSKLAKLRPAFKEEGTVTAGNASGINDGASVVILASQEYVEANGITPLVEIIGFGQSGVDPQIMGMGPVEAVGQALKRTGLRLEDMTTIELNEAFASQSLAVVRQLATLHQADAHELSERINPLGGAIALGHPLGATGARITTTLIHQLPKDTYGLASLCIGGGMGTAIIVKKV